MTKSYDLPSEKVLRAFTLGLDQARTIGGWITEDEYNEGLDIIKALGPDDDQEEA